MSFNVDDWGTTVKDYAGYDDNGTEKGGVNWNRSCRVGACYNFDGTNDNISIADSSRLDITTEITLEAWINTTSNNMAIIEKRGPFTTYFNGYLCSKVCNKGFISS